MSNLRDAFSVDQFNEAIKRASCLHLFDQCVTELDRDELLVALTIAMDQYKSAVDFHESHKRMHATIEAAKHRFGYWE